MPILFRKAEQQEPHPHPDVCSSDLITDIGIVALFEREENFETYCSNVEIEANKIALDITKEEKEFLIIK